MTASYASGGTFYKSWIAKAAGDSVANELVNNFQHRHAEELYYVVKDSLEMNNLAENPQYAIIKEDLKVRFVIWMEQQGDKGQQTEMEATDHQVKN